MKFSNQILDENSPVFLFSQDKKRKKEAKQNKTKQNKNKKTLFHWEAVCNLPEIC